MSWACREAEVTTVSSTCGFSGGSCTAARQTPFLPKVEEWRERSNGQIRADVVHDKLLGMGLPGAERTTWRAVRKVRRAFKAGRVRVHRPWVTEPGKQRNGKLAVRRPPTSLIYRYSTPKRTPNHLKTEAAECSDSTRQSKGSRKAKDVFGYVGQNHVGRNRRHLIEPGFTKLPLDVVADVEGIASKGLHRRIGCLPRGVGG
jgi:hypothetical protein